MEIKPMRDEVEVAIKALIKSATETQEASQALHFSQSAVNLAQALACFMESKRYD